MTNDEQAATLERIAHDPIVVAMDGLRIALRRLMFWPWSAKRQDAVIVALNTVLELHTNRVQGAAGHILTGPYERLAVQQGRHEKRIAKLERPRERQAGE